MVFFYDKLTGSVMKFRNMFLGNFFPPGSGSDPDVPTISLEGLYRDLEINTYGIHIGSSVH